MDFIIIIGLFVHYAADFVFQTDWQARNKSVNSIALIDHVVIYSTTWWIVMFIVMWSVKYTFPAAAFMSMFFAGITFLFHICTDYFTSRAAKKYFDSGNAHNGFVVIGFDQILHYLQLYYTYKLLM